MSLVATAGEKAQISESRSRGQIKEERKQTKGSRSRVTIDSIVIK